MADKTIKTVVVNEVVIGDGVPKIFVPIAGDTPQRLRAQADALTGRPVDVVEWRADRFRDLADTAAVVSAARMLAERLAGTPLLFTCRTRAEGGEAEIGDEAYGELNIALVESATVDLVDVEYLRRREVVERILTDAHAHGVAVIASNHDFTGTPDRDEIVGRLRAMQRLGADICKIAVMPHSAADVLTLLDATRTMHEEYADRPLITVSMGGLGVVSRLAGQVFGSAATFGMAGTPSAPGQIDVADLHAALRLLDRTR